ncbi:MAG: DMT family transporter [Myxococcales bacterium]|nr:DMT family transporter [Myxococcales bacterium]
MPAAPRFSGTAVIAVSSLFFAVMAVLARTLAGEVPPAQVVTVRHLVGLAGMALFFPALRRKPNLARPWLLLLRGVLGGTAVLMYFTAIRHLGAAPATVLNYAAPVYAAFFAAVFLKERPTRLMVVGLFLASAGAALVAMSGEGLHLTGAGSLGALAGLASGVAGGAAMTSIKAVREDADAGTVFLAFSVVGLVMAAPVAAPDWVPLQGAVALRVVGVGVLALFGQMLFTWGMGHTSATVGSATTQLVPAFAWALAIGVLGEGVTPAAVLGAAMCVAGVLLGAVSARRRLPAPEAPAAASARPE